MTINTLATARQALANMKAGLTPDGRKRETPERKAK